MTANKVTRRIIAIGQGINPAIIRHFVKLTGVERPRICLLPTATADDPKVIHIWHGFGQKFDFDAFVQPMFISSFDQKKTFEEVLLGMDAIYVSGGNTINMLAVWKAQGVDMILRKAYEKGVLLGGGSAGGICWFENGLTDSRPVELTAMRALGWLKGSFTPHFLSEPGRRNYCHKYILSGEMSSGYAIDEPVGILFENEVYVNAVGSKPDAEGFWVERRGDEVVESPIEIQYLGDVV